MTPKIELANWQSYKEGMKSLLSIDPTRTVGLDPGAPWNSDVIDRGLYLTPPVVLSKQILIDTSGYR